MKILAFAEQREGKFKKSGFEVTQAAGRIAGELGLELVAVVIGDNVAGMAAELGSYGAKRVLAVQDPRLKYYSTTAYAKIVAELAKRESASMVFLPASQMGKDLASRIGAKLGAGVAADCTSLSVNGGDVVATRPIYAGKATVSVKVLSPVKVFTLRPNVFTASSTGSAPAAVEPAAVELSDADFAAAVTSVKVATGRPDVTEAAIIVSGGRGMKGPEHFHLVESLADPENFFALGIQQELNGRLEVAQTFLLGIALSVRAGNF